MKHQIMMPSAIATRFVPVSSKGLVPQPGQSAAVRAIGCPHFFARHQVRIHHVLTYATRDLMIASISWRRPRVVDFPAATVPSASYHRSRSAKCNTSTNAWKAVSPSTSSSSSANISITSPAPRAIIGSVRLSSDVVAKLESLGRNESRAQNAQLMPNSTDSTAKLASTVASKVAINPLNH